MDDLRRFLKSRYNPAPLNAQIQQNEHKKAKESTEDELMEIIQKIEAFNKGYDVLLEEVELKAKDGHFQAHPDLEPVSLDLIRVEDDSFEEAVEELISDKFNHTAYLEDIFEYDEKILLNLYQIAIGFYEDAQLEKAILAFTFLTYVDPALSAFWMGLGLSHERNQNVVEAIRGYKMAVKQSDNFTPYYSLIRCCETIGDFTEALDLLKNLKESGQFPNETEAALEYIAQLKT